MTLSAFEDSLGGWPDDKSSQANGLSFRSYYLALGAALVALVAVPFSWWILTTVSSWPDKALSEELCMLFYLAQPVIIIIFTSLYFAQEFVKSGIRTKATLTPYQIEGSLAGEKITFCSCCSWSSSIMIGSCFLVMLARFDLSWSLTGDLLYYSSLVSSVSFSGFLTASSAFIFQSWVFIAGVVPSFLYDWSPAVYWRTFMK